MVAKKEDLDIVSEGGESNEKAGPNSEDIKRSADEDEANSSAQLSGYSGNVPASSVYEIINKAVNKEKLTIAFPKTWGRRIQYFFLIPLTHF